MLKRVLLGGGREGGSSTRFLSLPPFFSGIWLLGGRRGGGFVCPGVVTTSRDVDWSGRCARLETRRPKKIHDEKTFEKVKINQVQQHFV